LVIGPILSFARTESTVCLPLRAESLPKEPEMQELRSAILWRIASAQCTDRTQYQVCTADAFTEFFVGDPKKQWRRLFGAAIANRLQKPD
jgi:hypothetical protein